MFAFDCTDEALDGRLRSVLPQNPSDTATLVLDRQIDSGLT